MVYKYNKSFETNKKRNENSKDKDKFKDKKRKIISCQKNKGNNNIKDNKYQRNHNLKYYNIKENKNKSNDKYTNSNYGYKKSYSCEKTTINIKTKEISKGIILRLRPEKIKKIITVRNIIENQKTLKKVRTLLI